jgi:hypothetical protein
MCYDWVNHDCVTLTAFENVLGDVNIQHKYLLFRIIDLIFQNFILKGKIFMESFSNSLLTELQIYIFQF